MRSLLTPRVFRAILDNRPYVQCRRQPPALLSSCRPPLGLQSAQRRRFLDLPGWFRAADSGPQSGTPTDEGTQPMVALVRALRERSRPPGPFALAQAFKTFVSNRLRLSSALTRHQVEFLLLTFRHLAQLPSRDSQVVRAALDPECVKTALLVLARGVVEPEARKPAESFARLLFQQLCGGAEGVASDIPSPEATVAYISALSSFGSTLEALDVIEYYWEPVLYATGVLPWVEIIKSLARDGKESVIPLVMEKMDQCGASLDQDAHENMMLLLAPETDALALKAVYDTPIAGDLRPSARATTAAMEAAVKASMLDWASSLVGLLPKKLTPETRDALLLLAAAQGAGVHTVQARLEEMATENPELNATLTTDLVNALMERAVAVGRLDVVDEYAGLATHWGLAPNTRTYMLQMDARIKVGDIRGVVYLFDQVESDMVSDRESVPLINRLIAQLCEAGHEDAEYEIILSLTDRLVETGSGFEAQALSGLCRVLLYRHDLESISTLLRPIIDSYGAAELSLIGDAFVRYISDSAESTENVWGAYELLNMAFPSTSVSVRTDIMTAFFSRRRSDLACLVFGHMRQKDEVESRPGPDTYALCFQGIARTADGDSLRLVHNMLKLDIEMRLTTRVLNGLMLAYAACGSPNHAIAFFRDILHSAEGPSPDTLTIFFRVCETLPHGVDEATRMIEKLRSQDIEVDPAAYNAYVGALGGHCQLEQAMEAVRAMRDITGDSPSALTLGTLHNAIPYPYWKDQADEWMRRVYPDLWEELEKTGRTSGDGEDGRNFNIDRSIDI